MYVIFFFFFFYLKYFFDVNLILIFIHTRMRFELLSFGPYRVSIDVVVSRIMTATTCLLGHIKHWPCSVLIAFVETDGWPLQPVADTLISN